MGLFFSEAGAEARGGKKQAQKTIKIAALNPDKLNCGTCPLNEAQLQHPKIAPHGAARPLVYFLGETPGRAEDRYGAHFSGSAGEEVRDRLPIKYAKHVRFNNTIRCYPGKQREPEPIETASCRRQQEEDIQRSKPKVIVGFGDAPLQWLLDTKGIGTWRGRRAPVRVGTHTCWYYPLASPGVLLTEGQDRRMGEAIRKCFERDLARVWDDLEAGLPEPYVENAKDWAAGIECVTDFGIQGLKQIEDALGWVSGEEHGIDIETNQLRPYNKDSKILTIAVGTYERVIAFPWKHPEARWPPKYLKIIRDMIGTYLLRAGGTKIAHNAKFEQEWFAYEFGPDVLWRGRWDDTLGQAHVLDCRYGKELEDLTLLHFGFNLKAQSQNVDVRNMEAEPLSRILPYNGGDSKYCHALFPIQRELLMQNNLLHVYERLNSETPAIVLTQAKGLVRDIPEAIRLQKKYEGLEAEHKQRIMEHKDVKAFMAKHGKFAPTSNPDLVKFFRDFMQIPHPQRRRAPGSYSVDKENLPKIKHPVTSMLLDMRAASKVQDYLIPILDNPRGKHVYDDGLIHPTYSQYVTVTGRLNSADPNIQNWPRRKNKEIRGAIGCPPGHIIAPFDYGQLEARIIAAITKDVVLCAEIANRQDIHGDWADLIGGKFAPRLLKENRKSVRDSIKQYWTFANFFGNVLEAVANDLARELKANITPDALSPIFDEFWKKYKGVLKWQEELLAFYWKNGYVETAFNQRRYEPMNRNELINQPIQGTAGQLVIDAQARLSRAAYERDMPALQPVMNIHDDLSFYLPIDEAEELVPMIAEAMVCTPFDFITVPLSVAVKLGDNWANGEEVATFFTDDFR